MVPELTYMTYDQGAPESPGKGGSGSAVAPKTLRKAPFMMRSSGQKPIWTRSPTW